jgi:probable rRNA maturation factor
MPAVEIIVESDLWADEPDAETTVRRAIDEAAAQASPRPVADGEVAVVLSDDVAVRALNDRWRGIDAATNVLSFPAGAGAPMMLGDIVIAYETVVREAAAQGKPFVGHLAHLAVHGFLHLVGYDHQSDDAADAMEGLEREILARLGIPDPYATGDAERHA